MISVEKTVLMVNAMGHNITESDLLEIIRSGEIETGFADLIFQQSTKYTFYILKDSLIPYLKECYKYNDNYLESLFL
ncbi:hypothetical protein ACNA06_17870 [Lysinibacillus sp. RSDA_15]|uniref:hypothetical protein n=1 Tax=Lysinibacillus sp. RSDA_15 TaxID=3391421 RepID=UPI003A4DF64B